MENLTPKEKAVELVVSMSFCLTEHPVPHINIAKQCALIAVEEVYNLNLKVGQHLDEDDDKDNYYSYWEEVRREIEKL